MHLAMVREDFDTGDTELTIFSECFFFPAALSLSCRRLVLLSPPKPDFASKRPGAQKYPAPSGALFSKSSQVNTLPKAKSKTRSKQNKNMHKCSSVYSERGVPLPVLTSGGE